MSDDFLDNPAFPGESPILEHTGLTKLEWASVKIAAAMIASGSKDCPEELSLEAVRVAVAVLKQVWAAGEPGEKHPTSGYAP